MKWLVAVAALFATAAWAEPAATAAAPAFQPVSFNFWSWFQVVLALAVVLAAIAGSAWLARRFAPGQSAGGSLRVVGGVAVGPKERVVLVEIGETWLVVGVAPGQVNALHVLPKQTAVETGGAEGAAAPAFAEWLKKAVQNRNPEK